MDLENGFAGLRVWFLWGCARRASRQIEYQFSIITIKSFFGLILAKRMFLTNY